LEKIRNAPNQEDATIFQKKAFGMIYRRSDIERALEWVRNDNTGFPGWKLGQLDRWSIIKRYASLTSDASAYVESELQRDSSDTGHLAKIYCEAAYPIIESKREKWEKYLNDGEKMSRYDREASMGGFNQQRQTEILSWCEDQYFEKINEIIETKDKEYSKDFCFNLLPAYIEEGVAIERLQKVITELPSERFDIVRGLRETIDSLQRFKAGKEKSAAYLKK